MTNPQIALFDLSVRDTFVYGQNVISNSGLNGPMETRFNVYPALVSSKPLAATYTAPIESVMLDYHADTAFGDDQLETATATSYAPHHTEHNDTWENSFASTTSELDLLF